MSVLIEILATRRKGLGAYALSLHSLRVLAFYMTCIKMTA